MEARGSRPVGLTLVAVAGAALFVAALFLPFQVREGADPRILDLDQGFRVWGGLALGPIGVLAVAAAASLLLGRWRARRAAGLIVAAGLWATLRGAAVLGISLFREEHVAPGIGAYLAVVGGVLVLAAGIGAFARAPEEVGARSRAMCALTLIAAIGYVVANLVPAARLSQPGLEPRDIAVVRLSSPADTLLWEGLLPGVVTIVLLLSAMRILTGTAGGTGALLMGLGLITALQFAGILAWAASGAVEALAPAAGVTLGIVTGVALFVAGLLSPTEPAPGPEPVPEPV